LISPRHERFQNRDSIVFDFRVKPGFKPANRQESLIAKLIGVIWIDPVDKQVMRLEARLAEGFKMAGGLLLSLRPGAALSMEQTRMSDGVWFPRFTEINLSVKVMLFGAVTSTRRSSGATISTFPPMSVATRLARLRVRILPRKNPDTSMGDFATGSRPRVGPLATTSRRDQECPTNFSLSLSFDKLKLVGHQTAFSFVSTFGGFACSSLQFLSCTSAVLPRLRNSIAVNLDSNRVLPIASMTLNLIHVIWV
jgi:hypothetical protein